MAKFRVAGISFDHMHMGDLLRMVHAHPEAEIAGLKEALGILEGVALLERDVHHHHRTLRGVAQHHA